MLPVRKTACTSPRISEQRLLVCIQIKERQTRIILHAVYAAEEGYSAFVVAADDTDVLVLCLAFPADVSCAIFKKCGTKNRIRYLDITKLCQGLGDGFCNALIGMHTYTGCESASLAGPVLGTIHGPIHEAASIHMQTVHSIHENRGHQHRPPPAFRHVAWRPSTLANHA